MIPKHNNLSKIKKIMNLLKKLFSPTILIISFLLLFYTFYRSEINYSGDRRHYYLTYYIVSILLICLSIGTFFISNKIKEYMIIVSISLFASLYFAEGYLTYNSRENLFKRQSGKDWDKRTKFEIYKDSKQIDDKIVVTVRPLRHDVDNYSIFSLSGVSNSKTIFCNESGRYSIYQSDRYGFNNPDTEWDSNEIEYLLVGDSSTQGSCVNRPHDIGSVLRSLSNKAVLNLGYRGNGPLTEYATLREYLSPKVKKVLWIYTGTDFLDLSAEINEEILMNYFTDTNYTQNLKSKQKLLDNLAINLIEKNAKMEGEKIYPLLEFIKMYKLRTKLLTKPQTVVTKEFKEVLKLAKSLTSNNNSKLYLVYLPIYTRYVNKYDLSSYYLVKEIANELKIPLIDLHKEIFEKEDNPMNLFPFENNGHYNQEGYKKSAETIYKFTKN